jgi:hypothetical protein
MWLYLNGRVSVKRKWWGWKGISPLTHFLLSYCILRHTMDAKWLWERDYVCTKRSALASRTLLVKWRSIGMAQRSVKRYTAIPPSHLMALLHLNNHRVPCVKQAHYKSNSQVVTSMVTAGLEQTEFGKFSSSHASENTFDFSFLQNETTLS